MKLKLLFFTTILSTLFLAHSSNVMAQNLDLSVSPPIFQIELTPPANAKAEQELTLENTGESPLVLDLVFRAFEPTAAENGTLKLLDPNKRIPGANPHILERIEVREDGEPIDRLRLAPGQTKKLDLAVLVPKDEPPSDYYLTLIFLSRQAADDDIKSSNTIATGGVGVNILLSIGPKSATTGILREFSTPFWREQGPVPFTVRVENTSSHFIYPEGVITIKNMFGQTIGQVDLLPVNILAHSTRALPSAEQFEFLAEQEKMAIKDQSAGLQSAKKPSPTPEDDTVLSSVIIPDNPTAYWNESFLLGPYTATLELALSQEGPVIVRKIHFVGFPLYILIGLGVVIMLLLFIRSRLNARHHL